MDKIKLRVDEVEANKLIINFIELRDNYKKSNSREDLNKLERFKNICVEKFRPLIQVRVRHYKKYGNYQDLIQEGYVALSLAMNNFDSTKGSWLWWAHKYIKTKVARKAKDHGLIKSSFKEMKKGNVPIIVPLEIIIENNSPEQMLIEKRDASNIDKYFSSLTETEKKIISMYFGFQNINGDYSNNGKKIKVTEISKKFNLKQNVVNGIVRGAVLKMQNVK
jgi:RNA polymerase sigma factor (sigma-70 family)